MPQPYSTPGNSSSSFYTPQATTTRRSQSPATSYFGTGGGPTGYSQSAWSGGSGGNNPSGIGAGSTGLSANDGPGGFMSGMNGTWQEPGYQQNMQWGSVGAPSPFGGGITPSATDIANNVNPGMTGTTQASMGGGTAPTPGQQGYQWQFGGPANAYSYQHGMADPDWLRNQYAAQMQASQMQSQPLNAWTNQYQQDAADRQAQQVAAYNANPYTMTGSGDQMLAGMNAGMPTQAIAQQMAQPQGGLTTLESLSTSGYQPGNTGIPAAGGTTPYALDPSRYSRLPVDELQRIASGRGSQLRPELQQQAAVMANDELARRGAAGNQMAAGNTQASGIGDFLQGFGQGAGWMNPGNWGWLNGSNQSNPANPSTASSVAPVGQQLNAMRGYGPFAPDFLDMVTPENIAQAVMQQRQQQQSAGGYAVPGFPQGETGLGDIRVPDWMRTDNVQLPSGGLAGTGVDPSRVNLEPGRSGGYPTPQTSWPIIGSSPSPANQPQPQGSMAIGPDGRPYGGTPNLYDPTQQASARRPISPDVGVPLELWDPVNPQDWEIRNGRAFKRQIA